MPCAFQCSPDSAQSIRAAHDRLITTGSACSKHPCALAPQDDPVCGFRDLTPEEKQRVKRFYAQRGRKHRLSSGFPNEERSR